MNMIYFLIGCSILLALIFLAAFFWASKTGQHDDTYTPGVRILFDDDISEQKVIDKTDEDHI
ncbi:MAG: cbb3-type cytochrome oxidase assembly protein CcoS [Candidatus Pedobacter colombiensis]|uniref:Cbb3-type cytochrome oxidase assembly protein CcoS n=1 Tax=Candidatus Pedobacter colombiensis TaxID=3121371 RepID=A0AAJ6B582_9SPHI|nr:cbb3-type cytochrome oxidase assembly protein CcoS [Pedobacter sp.]WEK17509.1 MAG: cbb3-type cytochrome oxidase assembly protein CcoS [Pedobacter sp.]